MCSQISRPITLTPPPMTSGIPIAVMLYVTILGQGCQYLLSASWESGHRRCPKLAQRTSYLRKMPQYPPVVFALHIPFKTGSPINILILDLPSFQYIDLVTMCNLCSYRHSHLCSLSSLASFLNFYRNWNPSPAGCWFLNVSLVLTCRQFIL